MEAAGGLGISLPQKSVTSEASATRYKEERSTGNVQVGRAAAAVDKTQA